MRCILRQNSRIGALGTLGYSNLPMQDVQKIARSKLPRALVTVFLKWFHYSVCTDSATLLGVYYFFTRVILFPER